MTTAGTIVLRLAGLTFLLLAASPPAASAEDAPADDAAALCDSLAAHPDDRDRPGDVAGVAELDMAQVNAAISACRSAAMSPPAPQADNPRRRFVFQLGRALEAAGRRSEALPAYEEAARAGSTLAMVGAAVLHLDGDDAVRNPAEGLRWLKRAADAGDAWAMTNLGAVYGSGTGVGVDLAEARRWYEMAAAKSNAEAMYQLGLMSRDGDAGAKDDAAAKDWLEKAFAQKHLGAMIELGQFAEHGRAGPKDLTKARRFYEMAAALGSAEARDHLQRLRCAFSLKDKSGKVVGRLCTE